jgi:hypothetical protein
VRALWNERGERRLPSDRELWRAVSEADPRDIWWVCEMNSYGPLYFLPTREWISALSRLIDRLAVKRVLEVGAGDGFLSACLGRRRPDLKVVATDTGAWSEPTARMSKTDAREFAGVDVHGLRLGAKVERMSATAAVQRYRPDLVLVSWAPPGLLVERMIRSPVRYVLDVTVDGDVCGNGTKTWRFEKAFLSGALEQRAVCRLDRRGERRSRVTLYDGGGEL